MSQSDASTLAPSPDRVVAYRARRTLPTGVDVLTDKQKDRLSALFADDDHVEVEATWGIYPTMVGAYRHPDRVQAASS